MNIIDRNFSELAHEIKNLNEKELYHRMRKAYEGVPEAARISCMGFFERYPYWGRLDEEKGIYEEIELKQQTLSQHIDDFIWFYDSLCDYRSRKTLYAVLNNWYRYDFESTASAAEKTFDQYFDLDLLRCTPNEVMADLGAYVGDTVLSYIKNYGPDCYKRIYCYEITKENFDIMERSLAGIRDISMRLKGVGDRGGIMGVEQNSASFSANRLSDEGQGVEVVTLDEDIKEPLTIIKADIEGWEQKALMGSVRHIINDHPKLLISVYHGNEDLWKIPQMIYDMSDDYRFFLRFRGSAVYPTEIVLTAI